MRSGIHQLLFAADEERVLAYDQSTVKTVRDLKWEVAALHSRCEQSTSTHIVIACRDPWFHLVALLATHQAEKVAVFPNNFAQVTLRDLQSSATLLSDDANLNPDILVPSQWLSGFVNFTPKPLQANACQIELYTSGSTGKPKKIPKTLALFEREASDLEAELSSECEITKFIGSVSHYHIYGFLFLLIWPLLSRRQFDRRQIKMPEDVNRLVNENTALVASPIFLDFLVSENIQFSAAEVFSSGGPLSLQTALAIRPLVGIIPLEIYGSSETGGIGTRRQNEQGVAWKLFTSLSYSIDDGCMVIRSPYIEVDGDYYTDDRIEAVDEQHFQLLGRRDRIVKLAEKRVSLTEIEQVVETLPQVEQVVAVVTQAGTRQVVNLAVVLAPNMGGKTTENQSLAMWREVRGHLALHIESIALPRKVRVVDSIPRNAQGKMDYQKLQELFE